MHWVVIRGWSNGSSNSGGGGSKMIFLSDRNQNFGAGTHFLSFVCGLKGVSYAKKIIK